MNARIDDARAEAHRCAQSAPATAAGAHAAHAHGRSKLVTAAQATLHCLSGCVLGETLGLMIGVSLGLGLLATIALATALAYVSGFALGLVPVMRREGLSLFAAFRLIWVGEAVSIGAMEIAMNAVDAAVGGMSAPSVFAPVFWLGLAAAVPAGFLAALPVNYLLLKSGAKKCH